MKAIRAILLLLALGLSAHGQGVVVTANKLKGSATAPSGSCGAQRIELTTAGVVWVCASGTWTSSGGGTTINSTNGQVPYRVNSTTFGDSAFASNALNSTYLSATSGASGAGLSLTVAGGGTNEYLILVGKGTGGIAIGASDVVLQRDAANTLAQRNGTNPQEWRLYETYTDSSNYSRLTAKRVSSSFLIQTENAGTGSTRNLELGTVSSGTLSLFTVNTVRWNVSTSGHFLASADNTYDIGASGATRPRTGYFATNVRTPIVTLHTGGSIISDQSTGVVTLSNAVGTDFSRLQFGGTSASFGAIGRDGAGIKIVGADGTSVSWIKVPGVTVASLPAAATAGAGARSFVTDALTPVFGSAVTGGGAVAVPVYSDGANWIVG